MNTASRNGPQSSRAARTPVMITQFSYLSPLQKPNHVQNDYDGNQPLTPVSQRTHCPCANVRVLSHPLLMGWDTLAPLKLVSFDPVTP